MAKRKRKKAARKKLKKAVKKIASAVCKPCKLSPRALGLGLGILWGLAVLLIGLAATYWGYGTQFVGMFEALYPGFKLGIQGCIIGGLWGLVDGFVLGVLLAWLYNKFN